MVMGWLLTNMLSNGDDVGSGNLSDGDLVLVGSVQVNVVRSDWGGSK